MYPHSHINPLLLSRMSPWDLHYINLRIYHENLLLKFFQTDGNIRSPFSRSNEQAYKVQYAERPQIDNLNLKMPDTYNVKKEEQEQSQNEHEQFSQKSQKSNQQITKTKQINQTKNISKNFGKAILTFTKNNPKICDSILKKYNVDKQQLIMYIKKIKKNLNSLQDLRDMWGAQDQNDQLKKCLRIISYNFMRKRCLFYIYNSRIKSTYAHIKYRHRLMEGMKNPSGFFNIKQN